MSNIPGRTKGGKKGQSMVEFALLLPILIIFFVGMFEMGLIINDYISISRAVADACKYGSTLVGYSSAEVMVMGKLIDGYSRNIRYERVRVISKSNTQYGPYSKLTTSNGAVVIPPNSTPITAFGEYLFYRFDGGTRDNFADDIAMAPTDWRCSHIEITVEYQHQVVIPYANLFNFNFVTLRATNTWPITQMYPTMFPGQFILDGTGFIPIVVDISRCVYTGSPIEIKGNNIGTLIPGGKGWIDLKSDGTGKLDDLDAWISNTATAPQVPIPSWRNDITGNKTTLNPLLNQYLNKTIVVPVYDQSINTGSNGSYHIVGMAEFILTATEPYPSVFATFKRILYTKYL